MRSTPTPRLKRAERPERVLTIAQMADEQPALTIGRIRGHLMHRETNGLCKSRAVFKKGGRLYIDPEAYMEWLTNGE